MNRTTSRSGFSLAEVTLAMGIVAVAISGLLSLYTFAFREGSQGREDSAGAALAECVINPLAFALSSTNLPWSVWVKIGKDPIIDDPTGNTTQPSCRLLPARGWCEYMEASKTKGGGMWVTGSPLGKARVVYNGLMDLLKEHLEPDLQRFMPAAPSEQGGMVYALVISRDTVNSPIVNISVRCVRANRYAFLISQPLYYTAVHFQGDPNK